MEEIRILAADSAVIVGAYEAAPNVRAAVLLLHMIPATKESWHTLQTELAKRGLTSLAIDLRGHGESVRSEDGRCFDFRAFSDVEHQESKLDVEVAIAWLEQKGFPVSRQAIVGASIGANLAIQAGAENQWLKGAAALSPGLDYHGIKTEAAVGALAGDQKLFLAASPDDAESFRAIHRLAEVSKAATRVVETKSGHGTEIFATDPKLMTLLLDWLAALF